MEWNFNDRHHESYGVFNAVFPASPTFTVSSVVGMNGRPPVVVGSAVNQLTEAGALKTAGYREGK